MAARRQGRASVENSDVVEAEEAALKDVHAFGIFTVNPPGEVQQQLMEDPHQEGAIAAAPLLLVDLIYAPRRPGMDWRIHIIQRPLIGRQLPVGMHVPFARQQYE